MASSFSSGSQYGSESLDDKLWASGDSFSQSTPLTAPGDYGSLDTFNGAAQTGADSASAALSGSTPTSAPAGNWFTNLLGNLGLNTDSLSGLGPYAAVAGTGIAQAKDAQKEATRYADELKALGKPYIDASTGLLTRFNDQQLTPAQQKVVDTAQQSGQTLIDSGTQLSAIAQEAYKNYQAGALNASDEARLNAQVASQKQELRQKLSSAGITDSSILAGQDQQIENQSQILRQQLLDARFATGNTAYDQWLKSTTQGQALQLAGQQWAVTQFDNMVQQALGLGALGMAPVEQAIALKMQSDSELSATISSLLGNLAAAYAYSKGSGQAGAGGTGNTLGNTLLNGVNKLIGGNGGVNTGGLAAATTAALPGMSDVLAGGGGIDYGAIGGASPVAGAASGAGTGGASIGVELMDGTPFQFLGEGAGSAATGVGSAAGGGAAGLGSSFLADVGGTAAFDSAAAGGAASANAALGGAAPAGGGYGALAGPALGIGAAGYAAYGVIRSLVSPGMNNTEGQINTQTGDVTLTALPGGRGGMGLTQNGVTLPDAQAYYGPALKAYAQTGDKAAAKAALPAPRNAKEQAMSRYFQTLYTGSDSIFNSIDKALGRKG